MRRKTDRLIWLLLTVAFLANLYMVGSILHIANRVGAILDEMKKDDDCLSRLGKLKTS